MTQHHDLKVIQFKAPPPQKVRQRRNNWKLELELALKQRPGVWALVAVDTYPAKGSEFKDDPAYELRRDYRYSARNKCDLYMRYVGEKRNGVLR